MGQFGPVCGFGRKGWRGVVGETGGKGGDEWMRRSRLQT